MNKILEVENLVFKYEKESDVNQLNGVSFSITKGEWVSIIGQNGSGKSTTARLIDGLFEEFEGKVKIDGELLTAENVWNLRRKIGMVFQNPDNQFVGATVEDDVAFGMENQGIPREEMIKRVDEALLAVNMLDFKTREPARLSGGQKQRVAVAGIIALRPTNSSSDRYFSGKSKPFFRRSFIKFEEKGTSSPISTISSLVAKSSDGAASLIISPAFITKIRSELAASSRS